ncbi:hypothetical protein Moror_17458 [Moniliophthora roreri MCA 2997]|uniref:Uncharacterized protein n=1 Tax=Moniliophthora roreri (strain MCA 2997) TaxID=1381753 RepID=V2XXJ6_MONRO|nr:hypothetical protein Moror_17458 [Moniliophthora roreri MCA 2997]
MKSNHAMSAEASSSTQISTNSYKTAEEYPASDIPDLGGHTYPQLTRIWNNPEVLRAMSLDMPTVKFPAEVPEPEYSPLPVCKPGESATLHSARMRVANAAQSQIEEEWLTAVEAQEEQLTDWKQWWVAYEEIENSQISAWLEAVHKVEKEEKEEREWVEHAEKERAEKEQVDRLNREREECACMRKMTLVAGGDNDGMYEMPRVKQSVKGKKGASWKHARASAESPSESCKQTRIEPGPSEEGVWVTVEDGQECDNCQQQKKNPVACERQIKMQDEQTQLIGTCKAC